jgi:hypothetical protein
MNRIIYGSKYSTENVVVAKCFCYLTTAVIVLLVSLQESKLGARGSFRASGKVAQYERVLQAMSSSVLVLISPQKEFYLADIPLYYQSNNVLLVAITWTIARSTGN